MTQQYTSFLIRCWRLDGDERRIKIEHVQSGQEAQVTTLSAALAWLDAHTGATPANGLGRLDHPDTSPRKDDRHSPVTEKERVDE